MKTINESGIYVVSLSNDEPISSQAGDPRNESGAIGVNKDNIKVGKARNFATREKNYQKTFGAENVQFHPIILTDQQDAAEKVILKALQPWRATNSATKFRVEWLENLDEAKAIDVAVRALQDSGSIRHTLTSYAVMNRANAAKAKTMVQLEKQLDSSRNAQEVTAKHHVAKKNHFQRAIRLLLAVLFGPIGVMFTSFAKGGLLLIAMIVAMIMLPGAWPLYALVLFWGLSVWVALDKRDAETVEAVVQPNAEEGVLGESTASDRNAGAAPSGSYRLGKRPGALAAHNAVTWTRLMTVLDEGGGAATRDRLIEEANGHTDKAGNPRSGAAFVDYCITNGWLVEVE